MRNYDELKSKAESIFKALDIVHEIWDLEDGDLTYRIQINTIGELKPLNYISCVLYFDEDNYTMNLFMVNIYKIMEDEDLLPLYEIINDINIDTIYGKFAIYGHSEKEIIYRTAADCGNDFCKLDEDVVKNMLISLTINLEILLKKLMDIRKKRGNVIEE